MKAKNIRLLSMGLEKAAQNITDMSKQFQKVAANAVEFNRVYRKVYQITPLSLTEWRKWKKQKKL